MYNYILEELEKREKNPIDVIVVGLGFMGFGFTSISRKLPGLRVPLVITRRPDQAKQYLEAKGFNAVIEEDSSKIKDLAKKGHISISDNLDLIKQYENDIVFDMTGTVAYGTDVALRTFEAKKHLVTMNPELQATVGTELKKIADKDNLIITDVIGDQPGSLSRLISNAKMLGFKPLVAGNMKRYMDKHATQARMKPWADDKGLAVRQTVSFTDGTKQSIEMNLVSNYFGMKILKPGMKGSRIEDFHQAIPAFAGENIPPEGVVDYVIGTKLFPGVFVIAEHTDPHQQKYLRYLNMGEGPRYVLFDAYHLTHLEVAITISMVVFLKHETINNGLNPTTKTAAMAKFDLKKGQKLDGIGGDTVYGQIYLEGESRDYIPVGLSYDAVVNRDIPQDQPIKFSDVELPYNSSKGIHSIFFSLISFLRLLVTIIPL